MLWISPALPAPTHGLTAAHIHRIIRIRERQGVPVLGDRAYQGAGPWVTTALRPPPVGELLTPTQRISTGHSPARAPIERGMARLKSWQIFPRFRISPNRMPVIARPFPPGEATLKRLTNGVLTASPLLCLFWRPQQLLQYHYSGGGTLDYSIEKEPRFAAQGVGRATVHRSTS